jgi:hypothetical protein
MWRRIVSFIVGVLIVWIGLIVLGALFHEPISERAPVAAQREVEARNRQDVQALEYEEEVREQRYRDEPGPPYPVKGWEP